MFKTKSLHNCTSNADIPGVGTVPWLSILFTGYHLERIYSRGKTEELKGCIIFLRDY